MKTIRNKSHQPLAVPLPRGKRLFLGPGKSGQIASDHAEHAPVKKLLESGDLEVVGEGAGPASEGAGGKSTPAVTGPAGGGVVRRGSGDR